MYRVDNKNKKEYRKVTTKAKYFVVISLFLLLLLVVVGSSSWNLHMRVLGFTKNKIVIDNEPQGEHKASSLLLNYVDYGTTEKITHNEHGIDKEYYAYTYDGNSHTPQIVNKDTDARDFDLSKFQYTYTCLYIPNNTTNGAWVVVPESERTPASVIPTDSGLYSVKISYPAPTNSEEFDYSKYIGSVEVYFAIVPKAIDVLIPQNDSYYGDAIKNIAVTQEVVEGALCGSDDVASLESSFTLNLRSNTFSAAAEEPRLYAGKYDIVGTDNSRNYAITFKPKTVADGDYALYTIEKRPITVQIFNQTSVYGDVPFDFTNVDNWNNDKVAKLTADSSLAYTDTLKAIMSITHGLTLLDGAKTITSNVGTYSISGTNKDIDNYDITFINGTYTITKAPLTMTADNFSITYGDNIPDYTVTYLGFKNGQDETVIVGTPTFDCSYEQNKQNGSVGDYTITPSLDEQTNYEIKPVAGKLTVSKKDLSLALEAMETYYGESAPTLTCTPTGFVYSESFTSYKSDFNLADYVTVNYTVGDKKYEYDITWSKSKSEIDSILTNYDCALVSGKLTVNARPITVTIENKSSVYGETPLALTAIVTVTNGHTLTGTPIYGSDNPYSLSTEPTVTNTTGVGTYDIVGISENTNYEITFIKGTYTVTAKAITLTWSASNATLENNVYNFIYNGNNQAPTATTEDFIASDNLTITVPCDQKDASTTNYTATASISDKEKAKNYTISNPTQDYKINPKPISIAWDGNGATLNATTNVYEFTYNGANQAIMAEIVANSLCGSDTCSIIIEIKTEETIVTETTDVGEYTITATGVSNSNYELKGTNLTQSYKINPKGVTITWSTENLVDGVYNFTYNGAAQAPTATIDDGLIYDGDSCSIIYQRTAGETAFTETKDVGNYTITATDISNDNYVLIGSNLTQNYKINPKSITINWSAENATLVDGVYNFTYNGNSQCPTASASGLIDGDGSSLKVTAGAETKNAGNYTATASIVKNNETDTNYIITSGETQAFTIVKATLTVPANSNAYTYSGSNQYETILGDFSVNGYDSATMTVNTIECTNASDYSFEFTLKDNANYQWKTDSLPTGTTVSDATASVTITIAKASLKVTADNKTVLVGSTIDPALFTVTYQTLSSEGIWQDGLLGDDTPSDLGELTFNYSDFNTSSVTTFDIIPSGLSSDNYEISYVNGILSVSSKITRPTFIKTDSFVYDSYEKTLNVETDFENFDSTKMIIEGHSATNADTYTARITLIEGNLWEDGTNEVLTFEWTIDRRKVTIEWKDTTLTYNGNEQTPTADIGNVIDGDDCTIIVSGQTDANTSDNPTYKATASLSGAQSGNYCLPTEGAEVNFTISPSNVTITWKNTEFTYSGTPHLPTPEVNGLFDDGSSVVVGDEQTNANTELIPTYTANASIVKNGAIDTNYIITIGETQSFTIAKASLTITADSFEIFVNTALPTFTVQYKGFVNGETKSVLGGTLTFNSLSSSTPGTFDIIPSGLTSDNYAITYVNGLLTVKKGAIKPTLIKNTFLYDGSQKTLNVETDFENFDSTKMTISGDTATEVGEHTVTVTLVSGIVWTDGTSTPLTFKWYIKPPVCHNLTKNVNYTTVEEALSAAVSGDILYLIPGEKANYSSSNKVVPDKVEYTITEDCEIKSGVTLILPTDKATLSTVTDSSTLNTYIQNMYTADTTRNSTAHASETNYLRCTLNIEDGVKLTNNGQLVVSGYLSAGNSGACMLGHTAYSYAQIKLGNNASILQNASATTYLFGYIFEQTKDNGSTVEINSGNLYVPFVINDYRGFSFSWAMTDGAIDNERCSAFNQFEFRNIDALTTIKYGANVSSYVNVLVKYDVKLINVNRVFTKEVKIIGTSNSHFLQLTDANYSFVRYKYNKNAAAQLDIYGGAKLNYINLLLEDQVTVNLSTNNAYFPISYRMFVSLNKNESQTTNAVYDMTQQRVKLLPGSQMTINGGCDVTANEIIVYTAFYDGTKGNGLTSVNASGSSYPIKEGAKLIVNDNAKLTSTKLAGTVYKGDLAQVSYTTDTIVAKEAWNTKSSGKITPAWTIDDYLEIHEKLQLVSLDNIQKAKLYVAMNIFTEEGNTYLPSLDVGINDTSFTVAEYQKVIFLDSIDTYTVSRMNANIYQIKYGNGQLYKVGSSISYSNYYVICAISSTVSIQNNSETGVNEFVAQDITITCDTPLDESGEIPLFAPTDGEPGTTIQLKANVNNIEKIYDKTIIWITSNTNIASVDKNGAVTGIATGTVTISATCAGKTATFELTVREAQSIIAITEIYITDNKGHSSKDPLQSGDFQYHNKTKYGNNQTITFTINISPNGASYKSISWKFTASQAGRQWINDNAQQVNTVTGETSVDVHTGSGTGTSDDPATLTCTVVDLKGNTFTATFKLNHKADVSCIVEGTPIMLADGTRKNIEDITSSDRLLVFNHETGKLDSSIMLVNYHAGDFTPVKTRVINLKFSNGHIVRIAWTHGFFNLEMRKYVYIDETNVESYIGQKFYYTDYVNGNFVSDAVTLESYYITTETVRVFSPATVWHFNMFADGMLSMPADIDGVFGIFELDENLKYDEQKMAADIAKYGLYTYDDWKDIVPYEVYQAIPFKYFKVSIGKGYITYDGIMRLYNSYILPSLAENNESSNTPQNSEATNNPYETVALPPPTISTSTSSSGGNDNSNDDES